MSIKVMSLVWDNHTGFLTGTEKAVLLRLADFGSDNGQQIFPGIIRVSSDTGFCVRTVQNTITSLIAKKVLTRRSRQLKTNFITNIYSINVKLLQAMLERQKQKTIQKPIRLRTKIDNKTTSPNEEISALGGGAGDAPGGAGDAPGGGAGDAPNPLLRDPLLNNNNKEDPKMETTNEGMVVAFDGDVRLRILREAGISDIVANKLSGTYSQMQIEKQLKNLRARSGIKDPTSWIIKALRDDFSLPVTSIRFQEKTSPRASIEESTSIINASERMAEKAKSPEAKAARETAMKKLKAIGMVR